MSYGITDTGFNAKRLDTILEEKNALVKSVFGDAINLAPSSPDGQINGLLAEVESNLWGLLEEVYNAFNPNAATGATLSNLVSLNGITRQPATAGTVVLTATGVNGTVIPIGSQVSDEGGTQTFETYLEATVSGGTATLYARNIETGLKDILPASAVNTIVTPVSGWNTVTNPNETQPGRDIETDAALRIRRAASVAYPSQSMVDSLYAGVSNVEGVSRAVVIENDTDNPMGSQPAHSVHTVVLGGDDTAIADAIFLVKPAGIETYGSTDMTVIDSMGYPHTISFSRPTGIPIKIHIELTTFGDFPANGADLIKQAILDYAAGTLVPGQDFGLGDDVIYTRLFTPINTVIGHQVDVLYISKTDPSYGGTANIVIADDEIATFDIADIEVI